MMTQLSALSPIGPYGTRRAGRRAKPLRRSRRPVAQRPGRRRVGQVMFQVTRTPAARLLGAAALSAAALASVCAVPSAAAAGPGAPDGDHLTVTVRDAGQGMDGTYELYCHPAAGDHPDA